MECSESGIVLDYLQRNIIIYPVSDHLRGVSVVCIVIFVVLDPLNNILCRLYYAMSSAFELGLGTQADFRQRNLAGKSVN